MMMKRGYRSAAQAYAKSHVPYHNDYKSKTNQEKSSANAWWQSFWQFRLFFYTCCVLLLQSFFILTDALLPVVTILHGFCPRIVQFVRPHRRTSGMTPALTTQISRLGTWGIGDPPVPRSLFFIQPPSLGFRRGSRKA